MSVKNRAIWADVLMEQDLSESISDLTTAFESTNEEKENKNEKKRRIRPHQMRDIPKNDKNKITKRSQKSEKTNSKKNFKNIKNSNNRKAIDCPVLKIGVTRKLKKKVEITEESPLEDLIEEIRFRIWEKKRHMLREIIEIIGPKIAIELANQVAEIELKGGIETNSGKRRMPGGVFINLLKSRPDVDQAAVSTILDKHDPFKRDSKKKSKKNKSIKKSEKVGSNRIEVDVEPPESESMESDQVKSEGEID